MRNRVFRRVLAAASFSIGAALLCTPPAVRGDDGAPGWVAAVQPASDDAEQVIARFKTAPGFKVDLFAAEPRLANPVAFHIDEKGRFYVVETFRFKGGVLDIRDKMAWLDEDTASRTLAARRKMVTDHLGPEGVKAWEQASDRVKLIEDRDGDGKADFDSVFTAGDNKLEDGVASGVLARYGDVYYANIPSLYLLRDKDGDGKAEYKDALQTGYGVRYAFLGHDLHGLRFGPDGKLYFSMGDRGTHLEKSVDGKLVSDPDRGAVFRCDPDGSNIEIVHTGLRNPQELAFDEHGNLFTGDNNSDGGDAARWVQIAEGGDSGWRVGYQNQEFPGNRGPWNFELIWKPDGQQPAPIFYRLPPINTLITSGPSGLTYTPGTGMPRAWEKRFLLCDFRGGPGNSGIYGITNKPRGATFEMSIERLIGDCLPTDVEFGYDGGVYFSDWTSGWSLPGRGRLYRLFDPEAAKDPLVKETAELMKQGFTARGNAELAKLLAHADMRVRQEAQFALAGKGPAAVEALAGVAAKNDNPLARLHAVWGLGQIARKAPEAIKPVLPLLGDTDDEVRAQAAKVVGDVRLEDAHEPLVKLLADKSSRVRYFAAQSLGKIGNPACVPQVATLLRENNNQDAYLRHAGVMALVGAFARDPAAVMAVAKDESPAVRIGVLLALRKSQKPEIARYLSDPDPDLVLEAARAIHDEPIEAATADLAKLLDRADLPQKTRRDEMVLMRAVTANYRLGTPEAAERLSKFAARDGANDRYRVDALRLLGDWQHVPGRDHVLGVWRPLPDRDPAVAKAAVTPVLAGILAGKGADAVRAAAASIVGKLGIDDAAVLTQLAGSQKLTPQVRAAAMSSLAAANDPRASDAIKAGLGDKDLPVRLEAIRLARRLPDGMDVLAQLVETGDVRERQAALESLGSAPATGHAGAVTPDTILAKAMDQLLAGQWRGEVLLDLLEAAAARKSHELKEKLKQFEENRGGGDLANYVETLNGGDVELGRKIFFERADVSCLKCHAINQQGGNAGPDLAGIGGKQNRDYLLESLVHPQKHIAPGYETIIVRNKKGDVVSGVLKSETDAEIVLDIPEKGPMTIKKSDIDRRKGGQSAMPPDIIKTLSKRDLRNLVEYLASLK
jgi:quinoprotein glucose dehydrogenase